MSPSKDSATDLPTDSSKGSALPRARRGMPDSALFTRSIGRVDDSLRAVGHLLHQEFWARRLGSVKMGFTSSTRGPTTICEDLPPTWSDPELGDTAQDPWSAGFFELHTGRKCSKSMKPVLDVQAGGASERSIKIMMK